ncbi:MAG TPA: hypothetical protein VJ454_17400, partial [Steroidobacteraceae bacterium]|nr:hypothetical protein [Steroidobacteraceae bacterium]
MVRDQSLDMPGPLRTAGCVAERSPRQCGIEMVFRPLEVEWRRPEQTVRLRRRRDRDGVVAGEDARLELADPVPAGGEREARIRLQMLLEPLLVEP